MKVLGGWVTYPGSLRLLWLLVGLAGLAALLGAAGLSRLRAPSTLDTFGSAPMFADLVDQNGRPSDANEFRGKIVVANFIYTSCTDICPLLSAQMRQLQERLREENLLGNRVQLLSFSVDPSRDTSNVLRGYAERYQADADAWRFLTGPEEVLIPLTVEGFRLGVNVLPPEGIGDDGEDHHAPYEVMHSGRFVLIDSEWRIRAYYDGREIEPERVLHDVRQLLG